VDVGHIYLHVDVLLLDTPGFPVDEASDLHSQVCLDTGLLDSVLVQRGGIRDMERIIDHRSGAFMAGFEHGLGTFLIVMQEAGEEGAGDCWSRRGAQDSAGDIGDGFAGTEAFEDTGPAALVSDLLFDVAFDGFRSHDATIANERGFC